MKILSKLHKMSQNRTAASLLPVIMAGFFFLSGPTPAQNGPALNLQKASISQLEQRVANIEAELDQLAHVSLRSGVGSISYRSAPHSDPAQMEWVQINLEQQTPIDEIVLVPAVWRSNKAGFLSDGFPVQFRIKAGLTADTEGTVIAAFSKDDPLLPRVAPLIVPCSTTASWVRVETTELSPRQYDGQYNLELSEIMIFSGQENVALHQPITVPFTENIESGARKKAFLVDGFTPYLLDAGRGAQTIPFLSYSEIGHRPSITIDLEDTYPVNRIHLHTIDSSDTFPQANPASFGLPEEVVIQGANQADFSDATRLAEYRQQSIYDAGPIIMRRFPETQCRYIRITAVRPYIYKEDAEVRSRMGFAEIELYSKGTNVALNKPATGQLLQNPKRPFSSLTDGSNLYGEILNSRQWMEELAYRHRLENERPLVTTELNRRYTRQKVNLQRMGWLAALLAAGIGFTILIGRMQRMRQAASIKERFAADLHDELGANLHTIGLLSDLSKESIDCPAKLSDLLDRIRTFTERSGAAARYCTNMLEAKGLCEDLISEMNQSSARLLADLDYEITFSGEELLQKLKPRKRIDLFLFNKECLNNVLRHSGASRVSIHLAADPKHISLTIIDNGQGLGARPQRVPASLKRRAQLLGAKVTADSPPEGGTRITLNLKTRTFGVLK